MEQRARVVSVSGNRATVEVRRESACEGCKKSGGCGECSSQSSVRITLDNNIGAAVGDTVVLESKSTVILGYAAVVFLLPPVFAIAAFIIAGELTDKGLVMAAVTAAAFVLGFAPAVVLNRLGKKKKTVVMTSVVGKTAL